MLYSVIHMIGKLCIKKLRPICFLKRKKFENLQASSNTKITNCFILVIVIQAVLLQVNITHC